MRAANVVVLSTRRSSGAVFVVLALVSSVACAACATRSSTGVHAAPRDARPQLEDAFDGEPALLVVVRPARLARDPLYGPLVRRVSELASSRAALAEAVGTTALAAIERTEEVIVAAYDPEARDAVVALRGVPADVAPSRVMDTGGKPLWTHVRDLPRGVEELAPADPSTDAALFALPGRAWVIAVGGAIVRARVAFEGAPAAGRVRPAPVDDGPLVVARLRGDALVRARPSLADGPLAPLGRGLEAVTVSLEPGPEGQVGEVVARLVYGESAFAVRAELCMSEVVAAFTRKFDAKAPWLHAVRVSREDRAVVVRGRIPRAWADGFLHVDLDDLAR